MDSVFLSLCMPDNFNWMPDCIFYLVEELSDFYIPKNFLVLSFVMIMLPGKNLILIGLACKMWQAGIQTALVLCQIIYYRGKTLLSTLSNL